VVEIPSDRSLESFAMLYSTVHNVDINISNLPSNEDSLGAEILESLKSQEGPLDIDLRDANDLLPPLTAILALGSGGKISGATHARHKESNRIEKTVELLANFGIQAVASEDGISVEGGQTPVSPEDVVETHADHRLWMTAACLASKVGATLTHPNCFAVSDPDFLSRIV
jgi:3-phosphoshikimate 1-carboxyvinyltransferase